ncbi:hypothetical protein [Cytophaga aurantiaca]|uniref:hypothetical protein n=1 Tax=Cytophaga aurantiaca TaxID=29530 RepID=UPI000373850D|nr:hypothetical protein [Cytophaga aurantiaca]
MRYLLISILSILTILILWINIGLHTPDDTRAEQKEDILKQLHFLESELKENNLGERMQQIFPEGYVFIHALYGLSWCELALADSSQNKTIKDKAIKEALYAFDQIDSEKGRSTFQIELIPENGIFYCGWKNYLLSKILQVDTTFKGHKFYEVQFKQQSKEIAEAIKLSKTPYLESYSGHAWPADMFVAMASLSNYEKVYTPAFQSDIQSWLVKVKGKLDPVTHLIPHKVYPETGALIEGPRGSSLGLSLRFLAEIDPAFGKEQFALDRMHFITTKFGLPAVREYPKGNYNLGDVDSGPVIFGVGFSATIVMIGTMSMYDHATLANQQYTTIHAFGFETGNDEEKKYLFGTLPMGDAFIAWGRATDLHYSLYQPYISSKNWRLQFHLISLAVLVVLWIPVYWRSIKKIFTKSQSKTAQ